MMLRSTNVAITGFMRSTKASNTNPWMSLYLKDVAAVTAKISTRDLQPMDAAVFLGLAGEADWSTGRINVTSADLGDRLGMSSPQVRACISRLKKQHLVRWVKHKTSTFYCINPWVLKPATAQSCNFIEQCFREA